MKIETFVRAKRLPAWLIGLALLVAFLPAVQAAELFVGAATTDITPTGPVALDGQMHTRISQKVETPLTAAALALESREGERTLDQAIVVSCDLVAIRPGVIEPLRAQLKDRLPGFDPSKLFLNATHTHTAPVLEPDKYELPQDGFVRPEQYAVFLVERLAEVIVQAWEGRKPGAVSWGLGHAVVAQNRRAVYADGHAQMYGATTGADFRGIEGYEDHGVEVLFVWDREQQLQAVAVNLACTAQEVEGLSAVNADFFHEVRERLRERFGEKLHVLGWIGAAGDQSPHLMYRKAAEERMRKLRGLTRKQEIARRIDLAVADAFEGARQDIRADAVLIHRVEQLELPMRQVTEQEATAAREQVAALSKDPKNKRLAGWHQKVVTRFESQDPAKLYPIEVHVLRLGDVAIATNPFELYTDFGLQIKARSQAVQTFVIQLVGSGGYVPTARAVAGGGYSAIVQSNQVGPEGGQVLADRTVEWINALWQD